MHISVGVGLGAHQCGGGAGCTSVWGRGWVHFSVRVGMCACQCGVTGCSHKNVHPCMPH